MSIVISLYAIWQAKKYNDKSQEINEDTRIILQSILRASKENEKAIVRNVKKYNGKINFSKDDFQLKKLNSYDYSKIPEIMELVKRLRIKPQTEKRIEKFLNDKTQREMKATFYCFAEVRDSKDICDLSIELENYGVFMDIRYEASENNYN